LTDELIGAQGLGRRRPRLLPDDIDISVRSSDFFATRSQSLAFKIVSQQMPQFFLIRMSQGFAQGPKSIWPPAQDVAMMFDVPEVFALGLVHPFGRHWLRHGFLDTSRGRMIVPIGRARTMSF